MRMALIGSLALHLSWCLGGCLIVRTYDEIAEPPCPDVQPRRIVDASGAFVLADALYFIGANGTLSRTSHDGGVVSELTTSAANGAVLAADATHLYIASNGTVRRRAFAGGNVTTLAAGYGGFTALVVDDTSVAWASNTGLDRWRKSDESITTLDVPMAIAGLDVYEGVYYYTDFYGKRVRRAPPATDLAGAIYPGPLVATADGVYFYDAGEQFTEYTGEIRLVPREGGAVVTTATDLGRTFALAVFGDDLYFATWRDGEYRIKHVSRFGGTVRTLACGQFRWDGDTAAEPAMHLAVTPDFIYYADGDAVYRIATAVRESR